MPFSPMSRRSRLALMASPFLLFVCAASQPRPAAAGGNAGAAVYLTWNATDRNASDLVTPGASNNLYVYAAAAGAKKLEFKGGEIELTWNPTGDGLGCFDHIGTVFKTSSGTTCTYLNRGTALPVVTEDLPDHFHVAWANTSTMVNCTAGAILQMQFEFDGCADSHGCLTLGSCVLLDGANFQDVATISGPNATVLGGTTFCQSANHPPTINSIPNQTVFIGATLVVTPAAGDADGDALTFSGTGLPAGATVDFATGTLTYPPATGAQGTYNGVTITVDDRRGGTASTSFSITVPNRAPTPAAVPDLTVEENALLSYQMTAADADGDLVTWSLTGNPSGATIGVSTGVFTWTPSFAQAGNYPGIVVTATDPRGAFGTATFAIRVRNVNRAPVVAAISDQAIETETQLVVTPSGTDADGETLAWSGLNLPDGAGVAPATGVLTWTPALAQVGTYPGVALVATDGQASGSASFTIFVSLEPNHDPTVAAIPDQSTQENQLLTVTPSGSDADGDPLTWTAANLPAGANVSGASGILSWIPGYTQAGDFPNVTLTAHDGLGGTGSASFAITVANVNRAPLVDPIPAQTVTSGGTLLVQPVGGDPDGETLAWSGSNLPAGSSLDPASGLFTWTPGAGQLGDFPGNTLSAADPAGAFGSATFLITVMGGNHNDGAQAWLSWSSSSVVSDLATPGASDNLYVRVVGANSFKGGELDLTWSPSGDGAGCFDHISTLFKTGTDCTYLNRGITVPVTTDDTPNHLHVAWANTSTNSSCGTGGSALVLGFEFDACESTVGCLTMNSLLLLDGDNVQSSALLSGPQASVRGGSPACGGQNHPPVVEPIADQVTASQTLFRVTASGFDADGDALTWSGANLPPGATVNNATGVFRWTPTDAQAGVWPGVTMIATDTHGGSGSAAFAITVTVGTVRTYYADSTSACTPCDGLSWATAFHTVSEGIAAMSLTRFADTLFVAEGVYTEPTFRLTASKLLFGGYPHGGGTRDLTLHRSVLGPANNSQPIVGLQGDNIVLDGFTLTGGRNSAQYGTVMVSGANIVMRSLWITANRNPSTPLVAIRGAGSQNVLMDGCILSHNVIGRNGCIAVDAGATATLLDCDVVSDSSVATTGATFLSALGQVTVTNTVVWAMTPASVPLIYQPQNATVTYSDLGAFDPLFCDILARQFTLRPGSPCIGSGVNGTTMGALDAIGCGGAAAPFAAPTRGGAPAPAAFATGLLAVGPNVGARGMTVGFALAADARVGLEVFNASGQRLATLANRAFGRGEHAVRWNGRREDGGLVPAGVYVIRFASGSVSQSSRVVVVR